MRTLVFSIGPLTLFEAGQCLSLYAAVIQPVALEQIVIRGERLSAWLKGPQFIEEIPLSAFPCVRRDDKDWFDVRQINLVLQRGESLTLRVESPTKQEVQIMGMGLTP